MLTKSLEVTTVIVLTPALGIGANAAIFSIVAWLIIRLGPIAKPERVATRALQRIEGGQSARLSSLDFVDYRTKSTAVFPTMAASLFYPLDELSVDGNSQTLASAWR